MRATRPTRLFALVGFALVVVAVAVGWRQNRERLRAIAALNYEMEYHRPEGWDDRPHSPQSLFVYANDDGVLLRGSHLQVESDINPTPNLDRDGLAQSMTEITTTNLGWKATLGDVIECEGGSFRLVRRETVDRTVISAVSVRGNTTVIVSLAAVGKAQPHVDAAVPAFREFLASTKFHRTTY